VEEKGLGKGEWEEVEERCEKVGREEGDEGMRE
jgi:hypothetical protein